MLVDDSRHIVFLVGLPGSGKSTLAKAHVRKHANYKRVNKDELRFMIHDEDFSSFDRQKEKFVLSCRDHMIRQALKDGYSVVVDDTNIEEKHYRRVCEIAETFALDRGVTVTVEVRIIDTPLEECLRRNTLREGKTRIPEDVIRKMHNKLAKSALRTTTGATYTSQCSVERLYVPGLPEVIVTDADGTTCLLNGRTPYDAKGCINDGINKPVVGLLHDLMHKYPIIVVSGREDKDHDETKLWYRQVAAVRFFDPEKDEKPVGIVGIHMRKTGDQRKDSIIKREIYEKHILPFYNIKFVLDDRNQVVEAIRGMGIPVFQVAPGDF